MLTPLIASLSKSLHTISSQVILGLPVFVVFSIRTCDPLLIDASSGLRWTCPNHQTCGFLWNFLFLILSFVGLPAYYNPIQNILVYFFPSLWIVSLGWRMYYCMLCLSMVIGSCSGVRSSNLHPIYFVSLWVSLSPLSYKAFLHNSKLPWNPLVWAIENYITCE